MKWRQHCIEEVVNACAQQVPNRLTSPVPQQAAGPAPNRPEYILEWVPKDVLNRPPHDPEECLEPVEFNSPQEEQVPGILRHLLSFRAILHDRSYTLIKRHKQRVRVLFSHSVAS